MDLLERIREKPRYVRAQVAFFVALFFTLSVGAVWGVSLPAKFAKVGENADTNREEQSSLSDQFNTIFHAAQEQFSAVVDTLGTTSEEDGSGVSGDQMAAPAGTYSTNTAAVNSDWTLSTASSTDSPKTGRVVLIATTTRSTQATTSESLE